MEDVKIILSTLWIATMLTYLLGDVMRTFAGDFTPGAMEGVEVTQAMWLGMAVLFVIPICMVVLSMILNNPVNRWANIIFAIAFFGINIVGIPRFHGTYDKFLIIVSLGFNVLTVWYAWKWI